MIYDNVSMVFNQQTCSTLSVPSSCSFPPSPLSHPAVAVAAAGVGCGPRGARLALTNPQHDCQSAEHCSAEAVGLCSHCGVCSHLAQHTHGDWKELDKWEELSQHNTLRLGLQLLF